MFPTYYYPEFPSIEQRAARKLSKCSPIKRLISRLQKKPYSAVTVQIERLTSEQYEEDDASGIVDLVEVVRLQGTGPAEAARAIRKKLKYGNLHRQLRALTVLDGLIQNAGSRFQRVFADEPLLERLRIAATDPVSDPAVRAKCKVLFGQWSTSYKESPGMERIVALYHQLPQRKKPKPQQQSQVLKETEPEPETEPERQQGGYQVSVSGGGASSKPLNSPVSQTSSLSLRPPVASHSSSFSTSSKGSKVSKTKKSKSKPFNIEKEKPQLMETLATSNVASTNLMNALKLVNRESKRVSEDREVLSRFETCKVLRRQILRYIQNVESEQYLGSLIHANEELVNALMAFEVLDKSVEDDSDSDEDEWDSDTNAKPPKSKQPVEGFAGLTLGEEESTKQGKARMKMPMPTQVDLDSGEESEVDEDENDPFADRNAVGTPHIERPGMTWKEV